MAKLASRSRKLKPVAMFWRARFSMTLETRYQASSTTPPSTRTWKKTARAFGSLISERRGARAAWPPRFLVEIANDHSFPGQAEVKETYRPIAGPRPRRTRTGAGAYRRIIGPAGRTSGPRWSKAHWGHAQVSTGS